MKRNLVPWWRSGAAVLFAAGVAIGVLATAPVHAQKTQLNVYTALETDQIKAYENRVQQDVSRHRAQVDARLDRRHHREGAGREGEPAGRHRDRHVGVEPRRVRERRHAAALRAQGSRQDPAAYRDKQNPPRWVGMDVYGAAICFNTVEAAEAGTAEAESWKDLTKPVYKGKIVMPNPASSGTGFLDVVGLAADVGRGRRAGSTWTRCTTTSRSTRTRVASLASRRAPANSRSAYRSSTAPITTKKSGAPIDIVFPKRRPRLGPRGVRHHEEHEEARRREEADGLARDAGGDGALREQLRGRRDAGHAEAARRSSRPTTRSASSKNDFAWSAKNRERILAEWTKRYDAKSRAEVSAERYPSASAAAAR